MKYIQQLEPLIREVRNIVLPYYGKAEVAHQKSDEAADVVTELDRKVETMFKERLSEMYPETTFFGEEFGGERSTKYWLMDPIDGTGHFIRGNPFCTTMLALVVDGQVTCSVIYDFVHDIIYGAEDGEGAWKNGERIHVSHRPLKSSYVAVETNVLLPEGLALQQAFRKEKITLFNSMNAGYEFTMVASGHFDGRIALSPFGKDWDYAPGTHLVKEAGGIVKNIGSDKYDFTNHNFYAINPAAEEELSLLLSKL